MYTEEMFGTPRFLEGSTYLFYACVWFGRELRLSLADQLVFTRIANIIVMRRSVA